MTNNQGIYHLNVGGRVACKRPNAIMFLVHAEFIAHAGKRCKRCEAYAAKLVANAAKKAAHSQVAVSAAMAHSMEGAA